MRLRTVRIVLYVQYDRGLLDHGYLFSVQTRVREALFVPLWRLWTDFVPLLMTVAK